MTDPLQKQLKPIFKEMGVEDWMEARKRIHAQYLNTEDGRSLLLRALLTPLRNAVGYATRPRAKESDKESVANLVVQADAVLSVCTGGEMYDRALTDLLTTAKTLAEGVTPDPREAELAEWMRTAGVAAEAVECFGPPEEPAGVS